MVQHIVGLSHVRQYPYSRLCMAFRIPPINTPVPWFSFIHTGLISRAFFAREAVHTSYHICQDHQHYTKSCDSDKKQGRRVTVDHRVGGPQPRLRVWSSAAAAWSLNLTDLTLYVNCVIHMTDYSLLCTPHIYRTNIPLSIVRSAIVIVVDLQKYVHTISTCTVRRQVSAGS